MDQMYQLPRNLNQEVEILPQNLNILKEFVH